MALKKRGKTWHAHFFVDGQRFRLSLQTGDWRLAQRKERELIKEAQEGKLAAANDDFSRLPFRDAANRFLADRIPHLAPKSIQTERERVKPINKHIGDVPVRRITVEQVRSYIRDRNENGRSNATINRELDVIRGVLKRAKRWHHFEDAIQALPVRENIGQALTYEEKIKLLKRAATRPEWQNAACASRLAMSTTMRSGEIKQLRWRDVDMIGRSLIINKSKTEAGERPMPLNADAWAVILELYNRSQGLASFEPSHHLFPACEHGNIDPTHPVKSWRTAWRRLTRAIQCPRCGLLQNPSEKCSKCGIDTIKLESPYKGFRFHDTRHQAITELAESKASDQTIMGIAGHVSKKMLRHYSHIRMDAARQALDAIALKPVLRSNLGGTTKGYDTNYDTNSSRETERMPQRVDFLVELSGIEPLASSLRNSGSKLGLRVMKTPITNPKGRSPASGGVAVEL